MNSYYSRPLLPKEGSQGSCYSCMGKSTHCQKLPVCSKNNSKNEWQRKSPSHQRMWIKQMFCNESKYCTVIKGPWFPDPSWKALRDEECLSAATYCRDNTAINWKDLNHFQSHQSNWFPTSSFMLCFSPTQFTTNNYYFEDVRWSKTLITQIPRMFISYAHQSKQSSRVTCEWKLGVFLHLNGRLKCLVYDLGINKWLWKKCDDLWG